MSTSASRTTLGKAFIASVLIGAIVIIGSAVFVLKDAQPKPPIAASVGSTVTEPGQDKDPIVTPTNYRTSEVAATHAGFADESLSAIHEDASALAVKLSHLSSSQEQTEALIQEIATKFLGSPVEVPSYEQQQVKMQQYRSEVETQRHAIEKYEKEAIALARQHGIPEAVVRSNTFGEVQRYSAGRGSLELTKALTAVIHQRKIVEAAEKRHNELSQIQTLPPKTR